MKFIYEVDIGLTLVTNSRAIAHIKAGWQDVPLHSKILPQA